jgi:hypothetical protein
LFCVAGDGVGSQAVTVLSAWASGLVVAHQRASLISFLWRGSASLRTAFVVINGPRSSTTRCTRVGSVGQQPAGRRPEIYWLQAAHGALLGDEDLSHRPHLPLSGGARSPSPSGVIAQSPQRCECHGQPTDVITIDLIFLVVNYLLLMHFRASVSTKNERGL